MSQSSVVTSNGSDDGVNGSTPPTSIPASPILKALPAALDDISRPGSSLPVRWPKIPVNVAPTCVSDDDVNTPDCWVKRSEELIRLTGKHPFNSEARISRLVQAGFFTPTHLWLVRNHGAVPRVDEERLRTWTIRVHGLVEQETTLSLQDLKTKFPVVSLPITFPCAGNRRKEQNVVRKSLGFNWGPGGVSTALWTGIYLADVLKYVKPIRGQAKHVIFEGADQLPKGPYGTSQRLSWAANQEKGMLIAWAMNGLPLEPDHGFPVRIVIPGQIGGRSVKWLTRIEVSDKESQHYLHFWDNRVLPRGLSPDIARDEAKWWHDPAYLLTEVNVNSAISTPDHAEILVMQRNDLDIGTSTKPYTISGYAYSGGGRRVNRVEVTLDDGRAWQLATIDYPEDLFREVAYTDDTFGTIDLTERDTSFCWCFWTLEVPLAQLAGSKVIMACAMDESMNMQPRDMYLNATSMLNNLMFRVAILRKDHKDGSVELSFEHPAPVGTRSSGWMERLKALGQDPLRPVFDDSSTHTDSNVMLTSSTPQPSMTKKDVNRKVTWTELTAQPKDTPWFVVHGEVYDATPFLATHPGGADSITLVAGSDATDDFMAIHSANGRAQLAEYHIGTLEGDRETAPDVIDDIDVSQPFLEPGRWKKANLVSLQRINHDSSLYRFALQGSGQLLGLPVGQHVFVKLKRKDTGEVVQRAYTPISRQDTVGFIDFVIKIYFPSEQYPHGGKMTTGFHLLREGDEVELKGPLGSFIWQDQGSVIWRGMRRNFREVGMVCAGSGITPILQVLRAIVENEKYTDTRVWLICANRTEADILLREELDKLFARAGQNQVRMYHTLSRAPQDWKQGTGRITDVMLRDRLPAPSPEGIVMVCGPDRMISETLRPGLQRCGWDVDNAIVIF